MSVIELVVVTVALALTTSATLLFMAQMIRAGMSPKNTCGCSRTQNQITRLDGLACRLERIIASVPAPTHKPAVCDVRTVDGSSGDTFTFVAAGFSLAVKDVPDEQLIRTAAEVGEFTPDSDEGPIEDEFLSVVTAFGDDGNTVRVSPSPLTAKEIIEISPRVVLDVTFWSEPDADTGNRTTMTITDAILIDVVSESGSETVDGIVFSYPGSPHITVSADPTPTSGSTLT
jgi:hypothetical protein